MKLPAFDYAAPATLREALALLAANPGAKALAGGQSLIPAMAFRLAMPPMLIDLGNVRELEKIVIDANGVHLGARARWRDIADHPGLAKAHHAPREARARLRMLRVLHGSAVALNSIARELQQTDTPDGRLASRSIAEIASRPSGELMTVASYALRAL